VDGKQRGKQRLPEKLIKMGPALQGADATTRWCCCRHELIIRIEQVSLLTALEALFVESGHAKTWTSARVPERGLSCDGLPAGWRLASFTLGCH
jgi:hypothetical protein